MVNFSYGHGCYAVDACAAVLGDRGKGGFDVKHNVWEDDRDAVSANYGEADDEPEAVEEENGCADSVTGLEIHCVADEAACIVDPPVCQG